MKIVYRIVNAVVAAAMFPIFVFSTLFTISISGGEALDLISGFIAQIKDKSQDYSAGLGMIMKFSLYDFIAGKGDAALFSSENKKSFGEIVKTFWHNQAINPIKSLIIVVIVGLAVALLAALAMIIISCITGKKLPAIIDSVIGMAAIITVRVAFGKISAAFISGTVTIGSLLSTGGGFGGLVAGIMKVDAMEIGAASDFIFIGFLVCALWAVIYIVTEIGEKEENK